MSSQNEPSANATDTLSLDEFPPHNYGDWKEAAEKLLKGAPFEKRLVARTYEGFDLQPLYRNEDLPSLNHLGPLPGEGNHHRGNNSTTYKTQPWKIAQETAWAEPVAFNRHIRGELKSGLTEIISPWGGNHGLNVRTIEDLETAFEGIDLTEVALTIETQEDAFPASALLFAYLESQSIDLRKFTACIANDPLGTLAACGELSTSLEAAFAEMALSTGYAIKAAPLIKTIQVSGQPYANGGSSASQELGYALATGLHYLKTMQEAGIGVSECAQRIRFSFSVGPHFFIEIAKLRTARILWSRIVAAMGGNSDVQKMTLHSRTGITNKTLYDPHVNILRSCTEALSAILGGCDSLTIAPFDDLGDTPQGLSRRIAHNMHAILADECAMNRVIDPGGGSYYLEHLTNELAKKSWSIFQSVEKLGGMARALAAGVPQTEIKTVVETKKKNVATRRTSLIGTNLYPNQSETLGSIPSTGNSITDTESETENLKLHTKLENLSFNNPKAMEQGIEAAKAGASLDHIRKALRPDSSGTTKVERIPTFRLSEDYEALRQASEAFAKKTGAPPKIFQINLGPSRRYRLRADWTSSFFQVGGIQVINDQDFPNIESAVGATAENESALAIIVSDDATYKEQAAALASAVKEAVPEIHLLLAGAPGENEEALRHAGIDGFIHVRVNNYETLKSILTRLGALS